MQGLYQIIFYAGSLQGFILAIFLFTQKKNIIATRLLGLLTFGWGILLFIFGIQFTGFFNTYPHFLKTFSQLPILFFPLLFLNIKYLISRQEKFNRIDLIHFLPFIIKIVLYSAFYFKTGEEKIAINNSTSGYFYIVSKAGDAFLAIQGMIYSVVSLLMLKRYTRQVKNYISNIDKILLISAIRGIYILLTSWIIGSIAIALEIFKVEVSVDLFIAVYLLLVLCIYWISYTALKSPEIFKLDRSEFYKDISFKKEPEDDTEYERLNKELISYLESEKPFLQPDLSLQDLANMMNYSRHQLSALINGKHKKNFYEFINYYRVEEVKKMMAEPANRNYKIVSLAYDAGFNSKASFYRIFKLFTDMTPSQYLANNHV